MLAGMCKGCVWKRAVAALAAGLALAWPGLGAQAAPDVGADVWVEPPLEVSTDYLEQFVLHVKGLYEESGVPGMAVGLIQPDGTMALFKFGVREMRSGQPIDLRTLWALGPVTQPISTLLAARLAGKGELDWDAPARRRGELRLWTERATRETSLRHLLGMQAGVPRFLDNTLREVARRGDVRLGPPDLFAALSQMPLLHAPGRDFEYSEASFAAGAYLAGARGARASGGGVPRWFRDYRETLEAELFEPLGVERAYFSRSVAGATGNIARGYTRGVDGTYEPYRVEPDNLALAPARGLWMSILGAALWVRAEALSGIHRIERGEDGAIAGVERLAPVREVETRWRPAGGVAGNRHFGMGWVRDYYQGTEIVSNAGSHRGMTALAGFIPEYRAGFVVFINAEWDAAESIVEDVPVTVADLMGELARNREMAEAVAEEAEAAAGENAAGESP